jgi:SYP7 family syntaxin
MIKTIKRTSSFALPPSFVHCPRSQKMSGLLDFFRSSVPNSDGLHRSTLRDTIRRLKNVRKKAGKEDEEDKRLQSTGDPFRDASNLFLDGVKKIRELMTQRNAEAKKHGQDQGVIAESNEIRREMRGLETILGQIKTFVDEAVKHRDREQAKKSPKANKLMLLERQVKEREGQYKAMQETLEGLRDLDAQRFGEGKKGTGANAQDLKLGNKMKIRTTLLGLKKQREKEAEGGDAGGNAMAVTGTTKLEDAEETKDQMKAIKTQEAKIDQGLSRLSAGVKRLHELSLQIGAQIDMQNTMLDATEQKVDSQVTQIKSLNRRLGKIIKAQSPMNTFMTVACIILVLALVGFFLVQFGVI